MTLDMVLGKGSLEQLVVVDELIVRSAAGIGNFSEKRRIQS
jgi:hypothetical protein